MATDNSKHPVEEPLWQPQWKKPVINAVKTISLWGILGSRQPGKVMASTRAPSAVRLNNAPIRANPEWLVRSSFPSFMINSTGCNHTSCYILGVMFVTNLKQYQLIMMRLSNYYATDSGRYS